jgi:hypothetical protein
MILCNLKEFIMDEEVIVEKHKKKHVQDKRLEKRTVLIELVIRQFQENPEARLALAECGYSDLADGLALQEVAQAALANRLAVMGLQAEATKQVRVVNKAARTGYGDFRKMAQVVFKTDAARTALGLGGRVPADRARFLRHARAGFEAALTPDYAPALARRGFPESVIREGLALLDALVAADEAQIAARAAAQQATADRQAAMRRLDDWFIEFRDTAKIALRHRSDWVALLKIRG